MKLNIGMFALWALNNIVVPAIAKQIAKDKIEPGLPVPATVDVVKDMIGKQILKAAVKRL